MAGIVAGGGFAQLRVFAAGRVIGDAGGPAPAVAPVRRSIRDGAGRVVGTALFAVQSAHGYWILARALTGVPVLVRAGPRQLAGSFPGPEPGAGERAAALPRRSLHRRLLRRRRVSARADRDLRARPPLSCADAYLGATTEFAGSATRTRPPEAATRQRSSVGARAITASTRAGLAPASSVTQRGFAV